MNRKPAYPLSAHELCSRLHAQRASGGRPEAPVGWHARRAVAQPSIRLRLTGHWRLAGDLVANLVIGLVAVLLMAATVPALFGFHPITIHAGSMGTRSRWGASQ